MAVRYRSTLSSRGAAHSDVDLWDANIPSRVNQPLEPVVGWPQGYRAPKQPAPDPSSSAVYPVRGTSRHPLLPPTGSESAPATRKIAGLGRCGEADRPSGRVQNRGPGCHHLFTFWCWRRSGSLPDWQMSGGKRTAPRRDEHRARRYSYCPRNCDGLYVTVD